MTSEELAGAAASFRRALPLPDDASTVAQLGPSILHDLLKVLKACGPAGSAPGAGARRACMFFFGAVVEGEPSLERMARYDGEPPPSRQRIDAAWEQVLTAAEGDQQPAFQYMSVLRHADQASGLRTFDQAVGAFTSFARVVLSLGGPLSEGDEREIVNRVYYGLYSRPDDLAHVQAAVSEALQPDWFVAYVSDQDDFRFIQYFHTSGLQLDVNVRGHSWAVGGRSGGPYDGGMWRDRLVAEAVAAARHGVSTLPAAEAERQP